MKIDKAKSAAIIAIILMMASITLMTMPASAQSEDAPHGGETDGYVGPIALPSDAPANTLLADTNPYLSVSPNPTGINQYVLVNFWITPPPSNDRFLARFTVSITKPDSTTDSIGPFNSYIADGTNWAEYTVDQVGTWEFQFNFPGEYFPEGYYVDGDYSTTQVSGSTFYPAMYYRPSTSVVTSLTVLAEQVFSWPPAPLPTDYWTRPIAPQNREWYEIAGVYPWPYTNWNRDDYGPWLTVPNTPHIVWYDVQQIGGITGGDTFKDSLTTSPAQTMVTYAGRGYQTKFVPIDGVPTECAVCFDIRTGEQYYAIPTSAGGVTPFIVAFYPPGFSATLGSYQPGRYELLGGSIRDQRERQIDNTLYKINPTTGQVSSYPAMQGVFYNGQFVLSVQNLGTQVPIAERYRLINWTTSGSSSNFASRVLNNISFPLSALGGWNDFDLGVTVQATSFTEGAIFGGTLRAVSTVTGNVLWTKDLGQDTMFNSNRVGTIAEGKLTIAMENNFWYCWDLFSGNLIWKSELTEYPWGDFWSYDSSYYNGLVIAGSYEGVYAFNMADGKIVWNYKATTVPYETPYDEYSFHSASFIAEGKFFTWTMEHTATQPLTRGWKWFCLNATTGEKIWSLQGTSTTSRYSVVGVGDAYLMLPDQYSGTQWVVGRGKSATTVSAPDVSVPLGTAITIKGTVLDMSPAQPGTPCVSKESMELQMEYLHMQMPIDGLWHNESITGVPVSLTAIAEDGAVHDLGSVTTNGYYGTFSMSWTPPAEGKYEIIANFAADDSYGSSAAATAVTVGPAPEVPNGDGDGTGTAPDNTMLLYGILVAVVIAIVLALIAIVAIFRKR